MLFLSCWQSLKDCLNVLLLFLTSTSKTSWWNENNVVRCIVMRTKVEAPVSERIQDLPKNLSFLIDSLFIIWFDICNTQVSFFTGPFPTHGISISVQRTISHFIKLLLSVSLSLSPVAIWYKYSDYFWMHYHWINLIDQTRCFSQGIAHNTKAFPFVSLPWLIVTTDTFWLSPNPSAVEWISV